MNIGAGHDDGDEAERDIYVEYPAPVHIVGNPPTQRRTDDRAEHGTDTEDGHGHPPLLRRESLHHDRLADRDEGAAGSPLEYPEEDQRRQVGRCAAKQRREGEEDDTGDEKALAAKQPGQPAGHGENNGITDQIAGEHPGHLVSAGVEAPLHMGQSHIGHRGVDDLHHSRQHDRDGYEPFVDYFHFELLNLRRSAKVLSVKIVGTTLIPVRSRWSGSLL